MPMTFTLRYTEPMLLQAVFLFWRRKVGLLLPAALLVSTASLSTLWWAGRREWWMAVWAFVLAVATSVIPLLYFAHRRNTLGKFWAMREPVATMALDEGTFTVSSDLGSATMPWSGIREIWRQPTFWLVFLSESQFMTLPQASMPPDAQTFLIERAVQAGARIVD